MITIQQAYDQRLWKNPNIVLIAGDRRIQDMLPPIKSSWSESTVLYPVDIGNPYIDKFYPHDEVEIFISEKLLLTQLSEIAEYENRNRPGISFGGLKTISAIIGRLEAMMTSLRQRHSLQNVAGAKYHSEVIGAKIETGTNLTGSHHTKGGL